MTSLADEDHVTVERVGVADDVSCSPSSVTIVDLDLDATIDDEPRPPDDDRGMPTTLRVPTPSSWEKYRVVVPTSSSSPPHLQSTTDVAESTAASVKVVVVADRRNDLIKDDGEKRSLKKPCSCGAVSTDPAQVFSAVDAYIQACRGYET